MSTFSFDVISYNICLRRESGYCAVEWSTASAAVGEFSVSGDATALSDPDVTVDEVMTRDANCLGDYVTIPQGRDSNTETSLKVDRLSERVIIW